MNLYQHINLPIDLGKNVLTPECAYFLGAIFSADESLVYEGKRLWFAPVRHNFGQDIRKDIQEHMALLQQIIGRANGKIVPREEMQAKHWFGSGRLSRAFATKQGFAAVFESDVHTTIESFIDEVKDAMALSPDEVVRAFVCGAFDGRSAVDRNTTNNRIRYLALDCENITVAEYLYSLLERVDIEFNYNTSRDRLEGGLPRKAQLRVQGNNMPLFMEKVGLVSPLKFELIRSMLAPDLFVHTENQILWGLKTLSEHEQLDIDIMDMITPYAQSIEDELDDILLSDLATYSYKIDPNFRYSATPREKPPLVETKGRQTCRRDRQVAINALVLANHKCEIDNSHPSFLRKNSNTIYSEPHHLVPLAFHAMFPVSLDVEENIVSLCSNCHNHLHYGKEIRPLLEKLFEERGHLLNAVGINITLQELFKMYNA